MGIAAKKKPIGGKVMVILKRWTILSFLILMLVALVGCGSPPPPSYTDNSTNTTVNFDVSGNQNTITVCNGDYCRQEPQVTNSTENLEPISPMLSFSIMMLMFVLTASLGLLVLNHVFRTY